MKLDKCAKTTLLPICIQSSDQLLCLSEQNDFSRKYCERRGPMTQLQQVSKLGQLCIICSPSTPPTALILTETPDK